MKHIKVLLDDRLLGATPIDPTNTISNLKEYGKIVVKHYNMNPNDYVTDIYLDSKNKLNLEQISDETVIGPHIDLFIDPHLHIHKTKINFPDSFYHCTSIKNLKNIFNYGYLYTQSDRIKLGIKVQEGEGSLKRIAFDAKSTLQPGWVVPQNTQVEAEGIYFRVVPPKCIENSVALVFDSRILSTNNWHINTEENNGFYISIPGKKDIAPWGGMTDGGVTYDASNQKDYPFKLDENPVKYHELIVRNSIPLTFLKGILANKTQAEEIKKLNLNVNIIPTD